MVTKGEALAMPVSRFTLEFTYTKTNFIRIEKCGHVFLHYRHTGGPQIVRVLCSQGIVQLR